MCRQLQECAIATHWDQPCAPQVVSDSTVVRLLRFAPHTTALEGRLPSSRTRTAGAFATLHMDAACRPRIGVSLSHRPSTHTPPPCVDCSQSSVLESPQNSMATYITLNLVLTHHLIEQPHVDAETQLPLTAAAPHTTTIAGRSHRRQCQCLHVGLFPGC